MISKEEVLKIAKLARLELTEGETEKMQKDMSAILDYFAILKKADTKKIQKGMVDLPLEKVTREDVPADNPASVANNLIAAAPEEHDGYIKVKSVL